MYYISAGRCITSCMVQPKTPPISIRIPAAILTLVDNYAVRRKLTRHAALLQLLDFGLASEVGLVAHGAARDTYTDAAIGEPVVLRKPAVPYGSRLKKR